MKWYIASLRIQPPFIAACHEKALCDGERCEIACVAPFPQEKNPGGWMYMYSQASDITS